MNGSGSVRPGTAGPTSGAGGAGGSGSSPEATTGSSSDVLKKRPGNLCSRVASPSQPSFLDVSCGPFSLNREGKGLPTAGETLGFEEPLAVEGTGVGDVGTPARTKNAGLAPSGLGWRRSASHGGRRGVAGPTSGTGDVPMAPSTGAKRPTEQGVSLSKG